MSRSIRILASGWFGCGNIGDDAILEGILETIRSSGIPADIAALSYDPEGLEESSGIKGYPHLPSGLLKGSLSTLNGNLSQSLGAFRWADLFLLGGGGFLSDWQREAPWLWLRQLIVARLLGKKTMLYGLGTGPFLTTRGAFLTKVIINRYADYITVRDEKSKLWLLETGVDKDIFVSGDPALSLESDDEEGVALLKEMDCPGKPLVGLNAIPLFCSGEWGSKTDRYNLLAEHLTTLVGHLIKDHGVRVVGIPFMEMDRDFLTSIASRLKRGELVVLDHKVSPGSLLSVVDHMKVMIGMRYHSILFSALSATPFYGIVYHHKGRELVRTMGMEPYSQEIGDGSQAEDRDLDIDSIREGIRQLLSCVDEFRKRLESKMSRLKEREKFNGRVLQRAIEELRIRD
jgi:polysaccharide pyruvyl transferase WcaK-like protein